MRIPEIQIKAGEEAFTALIQSLIEEELAIASLIELEAKKIEAFVGEDLSFPICNTNEDILTFCFTISRILESILWKESLLNNRIEKYLLLKEKLIIKEASSLSE